MASQDISDKKNINNQQNQAANTTLSDFKILNKLGEGAYSSVYKVLRLADMKEYALKKVKLLNLSEKERENALNEVRILASVKQKNVISYKEAFWDQEAQSLCIVMEYADNGDLFQKICEHQKKGTEFLENEIWKVFIQVVRALKALHEMRIMHRDLKSANVFLYKDWTAKLGDMNVSKVSNYKGLNYTQTGTPYYASPEVWKDEPYDSKSDIWSLGCVLYEMITLKPPFRADDMQGLYKRVLKGLYQKIPNHFSQDLQNVVTALLHVKPQMRPSCDQILDMPGTIKRIEKFFPEEVINDKFQLCQEIKVPKNLMYLTDKLPGPNYDAEKGKFYKNRSEVKLRLPKLTNSMIMQQSNQILSSAQLEYQLPSIVNKHMQASLSIQEQVENSQPQQNKRNNQQQQIIIQVKTKEKKQNQVKISALHQQSEQKPKLANIPQINREESIITQKNQEYLEFQDNQAIKQSALLTPSKIKNKPSMIINSQDDSQTRKIKGQRKSRSSSRMTSAKRETIISTYDNGESILVQQTSGGDERIIAFSQNDIHDLPIDFSQPQPISSKSPIMKPFSSKIQQLQNNMQSRNQNQGRLEEPKQLSAILSPGNNILQDDDTPSKQYGYRYASLQPQKRNDEIDQTPLQPKLPQIKKIQPSQQQIIDSPNLLYSNVRSLSPYRNPSLIQPINSKQELQKLKHSIQMPKAQSSGKLPKLKGSDQLLRQMSKHHNYYSKGNPKLQNMYYRVANSYLKSYQPQMNIVGSSVKNNYQIYGSVNSRSQIEDPNLMMATPASYFKAPLNSKKIMQINKSDMMSQQQKMLKQTKETNQIYLSSVLEQPSNNQVINHALLARPIKKNRLQNHHIQQSIDVSSNSHKFQNDLITASINSQKNPQFQGLDGLNILMPKNQSQVLLKYQIQETKQ